MPQTEEKVYERAPKEVKGNVKDKRAPKSFKGKGGPARKGKYDKHPRDTQYDRVPRVNDPQFYTKYKSLSDTVARVAFNHRNGSELGINYGGFAQSKNIDPIVRIDVIPTPGTSRTMKSGINVSSEAMYKVLNRKYRGSASNRYQSADLGISQFAIMDFFASLNQAERAYGLAMEVKVNQRQTPRELLLAAGYDADDFSKNLAEFRAELNYLITRAKSLCLVRGYSLLDHWIFLTGNIFKDKDTMRGQYFMYNKPGYWLWEPARFTTGSALRWVDATATQYIKFGSVYTSLRTKANVLTDLNNQLDALLDDSDIDLICSDILAFFGNTDNNPDVVSLMLLPENYTVSPVYDENALKQFHNTTIPATNPWSATRSTYGYNSQIFTNIGTSYIPSGDSYLPSMYIYQVNNVINFNAHACLSGTLSTSAAGLLNHVVSDTAQTQFECKAVVFDTDTLDPSPDEVLELSRNMCLWENVTLTEGSMLNVICVGSVLPVGCLGFEFLEPGYVNKDGNNDYVYTISEYHLHYIATTRGALGVEDIAFITRFDWHPILADKVTSGGNTYIHIIGDLDNYIPMDFALLNPIHEVALLSEFHNPVSDIIITE